MVNTPTNKVALVTAGSAGLGAAIASTLAAWGARVVINYSQNRERAEALVEKLSQSFPTPVVEDGGKRFVAIQADMGNRTDISRLVDETIATMGRLDIVISNSGWTRLTDFKNLDAGVEEADWDRCFFMNVKCHLFLMHASRKYLDEAEGVFITTASLAGVKPSGSSLAYAVTKAAQIHLVKSLATIVSPKIRVNSVSPGILLTDWGLQFSTEKLNAARAHSQLQRLATVEDVAEQVLCFVKSQSVTGINAVIDCGYSI